MNRTTLEVILQQAGWLSPSEVQDAADRIEAMAAADAEAVAGRLAATAKYAADLQARLSAVRELHERSNSAPPNVAPRCTACHEPWPCPTTTAVNPKPAASFAPEAVRDAAMTLIGSGFTLRSITNPGVANIRLRQNGKSTVTDAVNTLFGWIYACPVCAQPATSSVRLAERRATKYQPCGHEVDDSDAQHAQRGRAAEIDRVLGMLADGGE
jgi:hypothetical protein